MNASSGNVVDSKIVELQFQNQNFESNAKTSLSTIERLKKALNFSVKDIGGFDTISKGVSTATEHTRGLTNAFGNLNSALGNIKNVAAFSMIADEAIKAKNAVESFVKSVSLDPISQGWQKYADKTEAVQTIMAATKEDFSNTAEQMKVVNEQLEKLNWFTDETSYNFVDMVGNIGKFTANRIPLEDAVTAMEGISTWAAISGQNAQSASRAMYNLAQAIGVGAVKLIDWRSVENANMGTAEFKQTVIETAESMKLLTKTSEDTWKTSAGHEVSVRNFTDALKDEWFTSEVLVKTLEKYGGFTDKLHGYMQEMDEDLTTSKLLTYIDEFKAGTIDMAEAVDTTGVSADRLKEIFNDLGSAEMEFGRKAFVAAQQAVTFEQAIDAVKDAASTAWMNTFEIMFGDFEQAKTLWTDLSENLWTVFVGGISETNDLLEEAFNKSEKFTAGDWDALKNTGIMNPAFMSSIRKIAEDHGLVMDQIESDEEAVSRALEKGLLTVQDVKTAYDNFMTGGAGDVDKELLSQVEALRESDESFNSLIETVGKFKDQDLSKIAFGDGELSEESKELEASIDNVIKALGLTQDDAEKVVGVLQELGVVEGSLATSYAEMTEEELKTLGWSDEQIAKFIEMRDAGEDVSKVLEEIGVNPMSGGDHWLKGLYNIMDSMISLIDVFQKAWGEVFPELEVDSVYQALVAFDEGTANLKNFIKTSDALKDSFKAIASVVSLVVGNLRMIGEGIALKGIIMFSSAIVGAVVSFVKLTGTLAIGASIFEFVSGLISGLGINIGGIVDTVAKAITAFAAWAKSTDIVNKALSGIHKAGEIVGRLLVQLFEKITGINLGEFFGNFGTKAQEVFGKVGNFVTGAMTKFDGFVEKVKALGGVSIDNFFDVMKLLKGDILEYLSQFKGFQNLKKGFEEFKENAKNSLAGIGVNVDDFTKKFDTIKSVFGALGTSIQTRFSTAFEKVQKGFGAFTDTGKKKITEFVNKVKSMGGIKLDNIIEIFGSLKKDVLDYFANWEGFTAFKDSIKGVWKDLTTEASKFGVDLSGLTTVFNTVGNIGTKVFNKVKTVGTGAFKVFSSFGLSTAKSFGSLYDKISTKVTPFMTAAGERISGFVESLGSMDSISLDSISGLFKGLWDDITTYFKDVDIVQMLKDSFSGFWDQMRQNLKDMGLNLDWLVDIFETIGNVGLSAFGFVADGVSKAASKVQELWGKFTNLPIVQSAIERFQTAFTKISEGWGEFVSGAGTKFTEFLTHVKELGGVSFDNLGSIFDLFKEDVLGYFSDWEGFGAIKEAFAGIWEDIKAGLAEYGIDIDAIEAKITGFIDNVKAKVEEFKLSKPFEKFLAIFTGGKDTAVNGFKTAKSTLAQRILDFFESIKEAIEGFEFPEINSISDIFSIFGMTAEAAEVEGAGLGERDAQKVEEKTGIITKIINAIIEFANSDNGKIAATVVKVALILVALKKIKQLFKPIGSIISSIIGYFNALAKDAKASAHLKNAAAVVLLAFAVGVLAKAVSDLSDKAKTQNLWPAVGLISVLTLIVGGLLTLTSLLPNGNTSMLAIAALVAALAYMLNTISGLDWGGIGTGVETFAKTLSGIDTSSIDISGISKLAGILDSLAAAGLMNSLGTAIQSFSGAGGEDVKSSLGLLTSDIQSIAETLSSDDFAGNLSKIDHLFDGKPLVGLNLTWGLATGSLWSFAGFLSSVGNIGNTIMGKKTNAVQLAEDVKDIVKAFSADNFAYNLGKVDHLFDGKPLVGLNLTWGLATGSLWSFAGFLSSIGNIGNTITGKKSNAVQLAEDVKDLVATFNDNRFAYNLGKIDHLFDGKPLVGINLTWALATGSLWSFAGFLSGIGNIVNTITGKKSNAVQLAEDVKEIVETFADKSFGSNLYEIDHLFDGKPFVGINLTWALATGSIWSFAGFLSGIGNIVNTITGKKSNAVQLANDIKEIADTFGSTDFAADLYMIDHMFDGKPLVGINMGWLLSVGSLWSFTGFLNSIGNLIPKVTEGKSNITQLVSDIDEMVKTFGDDKFSEAMNNIGEIDTKATEMIEKLGEVAGKISNIGVRNAINDQFAKYASTDGGENENQAVTAIKQFTNDINEIANALLIWKVKSALIGEITVDSESITNLVEAVDAISADGGLFGAIDSFLHGSVTEQDYIDFGDRCGDLGTALQKFNENLGKDADIQKMSTATDMLLKIGDISAYFDRIGSDNGVFDNFNARLPQIASTFNTMVEMIDDMQGLNTLGMAAAGISAALNTITDEKLEGDLADEALVQRFVDNLKKLKAAIEELNGLSTDGVDKLNEAVDKLGSTDVSGANNKLSESVLKAEEQMSGIGTSSNENLAAGMSDTSAVEGASANVADAALSALQDTSQFSEQGTAMITAFTTALSEAVASSGVADIVQGMMMDAISALENGASVASDYGGYFASGFATGISLKAYLAVQEASAMATAAANAIKNALSIASPSKVTYEYGTFFGEGFGNAIEDYSETAYKKASYMGSAAIKALGDSLNVIDDTLASEDLYEPIIRPVVDTSEIQNGATMIGSILSAGAPIRLFGDVKEINSTLDARRKAASLEDVVSALGLVERSASNIRGGDTYNVNGVTYDDGSNISDAVRVLIHAATVERRR